MKRVSDEAETGLKRSNSWPMTMVMMNNEADKASLKYKSNYTKISGKNPQSKRLQQQQSNTEWIKKLNFFVAKTKIKPTIVSKTSRSVGPSGRAVQGVGLRSLLCCDRGFESHRRHGCLSVVSVVCCQVEVSATDWSLVQRSPTECGVSLCVIKKPRNRGG